jgi:4-amino-4-deoxy-L-arabinose transferase-like glycosyltransferase
VLTDAHTAAPLQREDLLALGGVVLAVLVLGAAVLIPGVVGVQHDDGVYVETAQELAHGMGYRIPHLAGAPPQTKYPILYPAWLALWWRIYPSIVLLQWAALAVMATSIAAAAAWAIRWGYTTRPVAIGGALLAATAPELLYHATIPMSEGMYALLVVAAMWAAEAEDRAEERPLRTVGVGLLIGLPFLCRTIGLVVPLVPAGAWLAWRHPRRVGWLAVGVTMVVLPWVAWVAAVPATGDAYNTSYVGWYGGYGLFSPGQVRLNGIMLGYSTGQLMAGGVWAWTQLVLPTVVVVLSSFAVGLVPWLGLVRHRHRLLPLVLLMTAAVLLVWPWPPGRFLVPLAPLLAIVLCDAVATRFPSRRVLVGVVGVLGLTAVSADLHHGVRNRRTGYPVQLQLQEDGLPAWSSYQALFAWVRDHTDADVVLASGMDPMLYLYTGRGGFRPWTGQPGVMFYGNEGQALGTAEQLESALQTNGATHFVELPLTGFAEEAHLGPLLEAHRAAYPDRWRRVYLDPEDERFVVWVLESRSGGDLNIILPQ